MRRRLTIVLTEAQYDALASAVAETEVGLTDRVELGERGARRDRRTLNAAWSKIRDGWHGQTPSQRAAQARRVG